MGKLEGLVKTHSDSSNDVSVLRMLTKCWTCFCARPSRKFYLRATPTDWCQSQTFKVLCCLDCFRNLVDVGHRCFNSRSDLLKVAELTFVRINDLATPPEDVSRQIQDLSQRKMPWLWNLSCRDFAQRRERELQRVSTWFGLADVRKHKLPDKVGYRNPKVSKH